MNCQVRACLVLRRNCFGVVGPKRARGGKGDSLGLRTRLRSDTNCLAAVACQLALCEPLCIGRGAFARRTAPFGSCCRPGHPSLAVSTRVSSNTPIAASRATWQAISGQPRRRASAERRPSRSWNAFTAAPTSSRTPSSRIRGSDAWRPLCLARAPPAKGAGNAHVGNASGLPVRGQFASAALDCSIPQC